MKGQFRVVDVDLIGGFGDKLSEAACCDNLNVVELRILLQLLDMYSVCPM